MLSDLTVGDRLYAQGTATSSRKRTGSSAGRAGTTVEAAWSSAASLRAADVAAGRMDVRSEVDRMYGSIMAAIDAADDATDAVRPRQPPQHVPFTINAHTNARVATLQAMLKPITLKMQRQATGSTFGSGRKGMSDPVQKRADAPGPGEYHREEPDAARAGLSSTAGLNVSAVTGRTGSSRPQSRGFSFGTSARCSQLDVSGTVRTASSGAPAVSALLQPGPGDYQIPSSFGGKTNGSKKGSFGQAERTPAVRQDAPGPGTYALEAQPLTHRTASPARAAFASGSPRLPPTKSDTPGPGDYHPAPVGVVTDSAPAYSFPRAAAKAPAAGTPGPGTYNLVQPPDQRGKGVIPT